MDRYLYDKDFLRELDLNRNKEIFVRIISLTFDEQPIETIEGKATGGSINIDGTSIVRRSCSLTMVAEDVDINEFYWGLAHKFKLEIGIKNTINAEYPDICWFNLGVYLITTFNTSLATNNYTISISGKDKMCLLNGDIGGALPASVEFHRIKDVVSSYSIKTFTNPTSEYLAAKYYTYDSSTKNYTLSNSAYNANTIYYEKSTDEEYSLLKIHDIIKEAVHTWAREPYYNIIINDLDTCGLELMEYRGDSSIYIFYDMNQQVYRGMSINPDMVCYKNGTEKTTLSALTSSELDNMVSDFNDNAIEITLNPGADEQRYKVARIDYGETAGYYTTDLTYNGDLISSVGETVTSILDKIVNMLGDFEYFYDIDGRFVFQKKLTFTNTSWSSIVSSDDEDDYADSAAYTSSVTYNFEDNVLITAFLNNPNLTNLRNDFSIWGTKDDDIPIHLRYAIDKKPTSYMSIAISQEEAESLKNKFPELYPLDASKYVLRSVLYTSDEWDWRELIYLMAKDYYKYNQIDEFEAKIKELNPDTCPDGQTGYEQYYVDMQGFWRLLFNPDAEVVGESTGGVYEDVDITQERLEKAAWNNYITVFCTNNDKNKYTSYRGYYHSYDKDTTVSADLIKQYSETEKQNATAVYAAYKSLISSDSRIYYIKDSKGFYHYNIGAESASAAKTQIKEDFEKENTDSTVTLNGSLSRITVSNFVDNTNHVTDKLIWNNYIERYISKNKDKKLVLASLSSDYELYITEGDKTTTELRTQWYKNEVANGVSMRKMYIAVKEREKTVYYYFDTEGVLHYTDSDDTEEKAKETLKVSNITRLYKDDFTISLRGKMMNVDTTEKVWLDYSMSYKNLSCDVFLPTSDKAKYEALLTDEEKETADFMLHPDEYFRDDYTYWNKDIINSPETLLFWIDFLDTYGELDQFSVPVVGDRPKSVNDKDVKAIFYRDTPNVIFYNPEDYLEQERKTGYSYVLIKPAMESYFTLSGQGKSAKDLLDTYLYQYAYCIENVTITALPIYYLLPNTRVFIYDDNSGINGDYIVTKITLPLTYNGTMSITANKAAERLY